MYTFFMAIQHLSVVLTLIGILYASLQRHSEMQIILLFLMVSTFLTSIGYIIEVKGTTIAECMIGVKIGYIGKPFQLLLSYLMIRKCCGYKDSKGKIVVLVLLHFIITALVFTNEYHGLYYSEVGFDRTRMFSPLVLQRSMVYYMYAILSITYFILDIRIAIKEFFRTNADESRTRIFLVFGSVACGILGYVVFLTGLTGGYDTTMLGCFLASLLMFILFFRYRLFDVLTLVKDNSLDGASYGLMVLNNRDELIYSNRMTDRLLSGVLTFDELIEVKEPLAQIRRRDSVYSVKKTNVKDGVRVLGTSIEIADITDSFEYARRLQHDVDSRTRELQHLQRTVIAGLANIVEARDDSTGSHIRKTSMYVKMISEKLMQSHCFDELLTDTYVTTLVDVAPLHDIGKIYIPDSILRKPAKLTEEEFEIIKTHTTLGVKIVENIMRGVESDEYVSMAEDIVLNHHEKWDGSGYPRGLCGEDIPLSARIMAVADVYEAVRSKRCYKDAVDMNEAIEILLDGKGTHFDPIVVNAFVSCLIPAEAAERV